MCRGSIVALNDVIEHVGCLGQLSIIVLQKGSTDNILGALDVNTLGEILPGFSGICIHLRFGILQIKIKKYFILWPLPTLRQKDSSECGLCYLGG